MLVRPAAGDDVGPVAAMHIASWRTAFRGIVPDAFLDALDPAERRALWERVLSQHPGNLLVAEEAGAIQGFACAGPSGGRLPTLADYDGQIFGIHLDPACRGRGIGRRLMQAAFAWMSSRGCKGAHLWVFEANAAAREFYARLGGDVVARSTVNFGGREVPELAYGWRELTLGPAHKSARVGGSPEA